MNAVPEFQLDLRLRAHGAPSFDNDLREFEQLLRGRGWMTRRDIQGLRPWTERYIRRLASASRAVASGPGSPGYCRIDEMEVSDLSHASNQLVAQGREMMRRGIRLRRVAALRGKLAEMQATPNAQRPTPNAQ